MFVRQILLHQIVLLYEVQQMAKDLGLLVHLVPTKDLHLDVSQLLQPFLQQATDTKVLDE